MRLTPWITASVAAAMVAAPRTAGAQELEPRAYAASPVGVTFLAAGVSRSSGGVFTDPSLRFQDVRARVGIATVGVGHTFALFTRTALLVGVVPIGHGKVTGRIEETTREATRTGLVDARLKLSVNLIGGRALEPADFAKTPRSTIVGVSLAMAVPTGQYDSSRLINLGTHRWAFKPEAGVSVPIGRWYVDGYVGVWLFTVNHEFFPGHAERAQNPIAALQAHVSYTIRPRFWLALDATWYSGGTSKVNGLANADLQRNTRVGGLVSIPLGRSQSLKAAYSTGATTLTGGDFDTVSLVWQISWIR